MVWYVQLIVNFLSKIAINKHTYHLTQVHVRLALTIATAELKEFQRKCVMTIQGRQSLPATLVRTPWIICPRTPIMHSGINILPSMLAALKIRNCGLSRLA